MRFFADGPALPSELINARDEGRVVFFCGAGVSLARANLPDFSGLAESVVGRLRPRADGSAQRLLNAFLNQERIPGVGGLIATDRVFGLLEREFTVPDVRRAVAASLKPRSNADLSCHRTLIDLARGPDGIVRLVTTNFDRLFEKADPALRVSTPPNLPHPRRGKAFSGIVHLHGCVTKNYGGAEDDEFVLSSSDFGRAYLAEGWATAFIQSLIREYQLVFIGYAADDPPIQYLLEALSRSVDVQPRLYAFQSGTSDEASALWAYKGVEPIAYDPTERHATLWKTLEAWAERARDVQGWTEHVLLKAQDGPRAMGPVGRGQVAQLISTSNGASKFVKSNPPGEWICVMDRFARYGQPTRPIEDQPSFDPFEAYRLDDDPEPPSGDLDQPYKDREVPTGAWDAFSLNQSDREGLADRHLALVRGPGSLVQPELPPRIAALGAWIAESCDQPIVAWWAAGSGGLHLGTRNIIRIELERSRARTISIADRAWRFILAAWTDASIDPEMDWFPLQKEIKQQGWSKERIRRWSQLARPRIKVRRPWFYSSPLDIDDKPELRNILDVELDYPSIRDRPQIDDDLLAFFVYCQRQVIESSIDLEIEISNYESIGLPPIEKDDDLPDNDNFSRTHGLPGLVLDFVEMLNRLADTSPYAWRHEVLNWTNTGTIFSRLRIWAAGRSELNGADAASLLLSVPRNEFWRGEHQRDLLLMLASRWNQFPKRAERQLETRLRRGPARWHREAYSAFRERRAHQILNRLGWLKKEGIKFSFDIDQEFDRWRADAPKWREQYSHSAAASLEGRSGWVGRDTAPKGLEAEPPATLLTKANELSGHDYDALVDIRPLEDLAESHPVRFLRALVLAQQRNEFPRSAWETFLYGKARTDDRLRLKIDVARRLSSLPQEQLAKLATPISEWMLKVAEELQRDALPIFSSLWSPLLETLRARPESAQSSVLGSQIDWATHSLNSPVGRLAQALI
ncbi:MAG: SIR2 family NAD-dependent protein deacylase, partial [Caulobacteraceae bacterium]